MYTSGVWRYPEIGHIRAATLDNTKYSRTFGMQWQGEADMLAKTKSKINIKVILQHPILSTPFSHNEIVETGATNSFVMKNTQLLNKNKTMTSLYVQL